MTFEIGKHTIRDATPEEMERRRVIRQEIQNELPELKQWAQQTAARHRERIAVGTVFTDQKASVVEAIDDHAATHSLPSRGAVVREALARLLGTKIQRQ